MCIYVIFYLLIMMFTIWTLHSMQTLALPLWLGWLGWRKVAEWCFSLMASSAAGLGAVSDSLLEIRPWTPMLDAHSPSKNQSLCSSSPAGRKISNCRKRLEFLSCDILIISSKMKKAFSYKYSKNIHHVRNKTWPENN